MDEVEDEEHLRSPPKASKAQKSDQLEESKELGKSIRTPVNQGKSQERPRPPKSA